MGMTLGELVALTEHNENRQPGGYDCYTGQFTFPGDLSTFL